MGPESLYSVKEALDRIEAATLERFDRIEGKVDKVLDDHEVRLRSLERWKWGLPVGALAGAAALLGSLLGLRH